MDDRLNGKANLLIVDDDVVIAEGIKLLVEKSGYNTVGIAINSLQAIELAKEKQPDLILSDINLGNSTDGITTAEEIQKFADIPIIFLTSYSDPETIERVKKIGPFGYLIKPLDHRELLVAIETSLYKHSFDKKTKEQELLFRTVANFAYEWEFWLLPDFHFKYCSPSCRRITGYKPEEFISDPKLLFDIVHPDDRNIFEKNIQNNLIEKNDGFVTDFEFRIIDKKGTVKFISHKSVSIFDDKMKFLGRRGTNIDISESKLAKDKLLEVNFGLQLAIEGGNLGTFDAHITDGKVTVNDRYITMLGYSPTDTIITREFWKSLIHPEDYPRVLDLSSKIELGKISSMEVEYRVKHKSGEWIWILDKTKGFNYDFEGKPTRAAGTHRDITSHKLAEEALRKSEENFRTIFENTSIGYYRTTPEGRILLANPALLKMLGYKNYEELTERDLSKAGFEPEYSRDGFINLMEKKGEVVNLESRWKHKNGSTIIINENAKAIRNKENEIIYFEGSIENITERSIVKEALSRSEERYRQLAENSPIPVVVISLEKENFLYVNQSAFNLMGTIPEGQSTKDYYVLDFFVDITHHTEMLKLLKEKKSISNWETNLKTLYNTEVSVLISALVTSFENESVIFASFYDITDRKQSEIELKEKNTFIQTVLDNLPIGVALNSIEQGTVLYINKKFHEICGWPPEELTDVDSSFKKVFPDENYRNELTTKIMSDINSGDASRMRWDDCMLTHKDGTKHFVNVVDIPLYEQNTMVSTIVDITAMKKAEEELNKFFNVVPDMICIGSAEGIFEKLNGAWETNLGYSIDEMISKPYTDFIHPEDKERTAREIEKQLSGKQTKNFVARYRAKSGEYKLLDWVASPSPDGKKLYAAARDVTERTKLMENLLKLSTAVEQSQFLIVITDTNANIEYVNPYFTEVTGYKKEEVINQNTRLLKSGETTREEYSAMWKKLTSGERWSGVFHNKKKNGELFWESAIITPIINEAGLITHFIAVKEDITDKVKKENELKLYREHLEELVKTRTDELDRLNTNLVEQLQKGKELEMMLRQSLGKEKELNELKTRFISTASHEFRTPLTTVLTSAELIQRYGKKWDDEKYNEFIDKIKYSVSYLTRLIDDVLTMNRSESGKILFNPVMTDLYKLCTGIIDEAKSNLNQKHDFVFNFSMRKIKYFLDPKLIKFILTNLLSNAFKYSPDGGKIEFSILSAKDKIIISVADNGIGIPVEDLKQLFEPFHRSTNTAGIPGTGLGLSIVKHAVELQNGNITVKSKLGEGTTFFVQIPKRKK